MVCKLSIYNTAVCSTIQTLNFPKAVVPLYTNHLLTTKDLCREDNSNSSEEVQQIVQEIFNITQAGLFSPKSHSLPTSIFY